MSAKGKFWDATYTLSTSGNTALDLSDGHANHVVVRTPYGLVSAHSGITAAWTRLEIILDGRIFYRRWMHSFRPRTLITLAKRFAHDAVRNSDGREVRPAYRTEE